MNDILTIFVGDVQEYLSVCAHKHDPEAWLLDLNSLSKFENRPRQSPITVYTALGDLPKDLSQVYQIFQQADVIYYCPPDQWSDNKKIDLLDPGSSIQGLTEILLLLLPATVKVHGTLNLSCALVDPIPLVDQRKTPDPQLWIAGCSVSHGVGVTIEQRYGNLLAQEMELQCSYLTRPGSAIDWSADQLLRSDIRANDIVIWGITSWARITFVHNHSLLVGISPSAYESYPEYQQIVSIENLFLDQTFYGHYYSLQQVINYCEKIGAKLFLVGILNGNYSLLGFLKKQKNYIQIPYKLSYKNNLLSEEFEDLGFDLIHPGPKQHLSYKNTILSFIKQYH